MEKILTSRASLFDIGHLFKENPSVRIRDGAEEFGALETLSSGRVYKSGSIKWYEVYLPDEAGDG